jgi:UDP-GlcNAc3NAcA epimerase
VTVVGARPQFIKAAAVSREIAKHPEITEYIIHTGQHYDDNMSAVFFREMQISAPDYHLTINALNHGAMTGRMLEKIEGILDKEKPDFVLVYGDTNSTLAGALAAKKLHLKILHIEAGLRSFNMRMPEEINRILTDRVSDILCCPTIRAVENLKKEGFENFPCRIVLTGDAMLDTVLHYRRIAESKSRIIENLNLKGVHYVLCTIHREENTDDLNRLSEIVGALNKIAQEMKIVLPIHPRTMKRLKASNIEMAFSPVEPIGYFDMLELLHHTKIVLTDSGGLQKEAFFFNKPCVTLRDETEWTELVEHGFNMTAGSKKEVIYACYKTMKELNIPFDVDLYGNGHASRHIVKAMIGDS